VKMSGPEPARRVSISRESLDVICPSFLEAVRTG